jgi:hypothetical protein
VNVVWIRAALSICFYIVASAALAQGPVATLGEPLDTYIDARADYMFGSLGYCSPSGQEQLFKRLDRRWERVRTILETQLGDAALNKADAIAKDRFQDMYGSVDFAACQLGDAKADRRNYTAMSIRHTNSVKAVEHILIKSRGK